MAAQEISGYAVTIDPNQNVLVDDTLRISYVIVPVGVAVKIYVEEGLSVQDHFRNPDPVRVPCATPGKVAPLAAVPLQEPRSETFGNPHAAQPVKGIVIDFADDWRCHAVFLLKGADTFAQQTDPTLTGAVFAQTSTLKNIY